MLSTDGFLMDSLEYMLYFNGKYAQQFQLAVSEYPSIPQLNEDVEEIEIEGRSGNLIVKKGTYKDRKLTFKLKMLDVNNMWVMCDGILQWLNNITDNKLMYDREDRHFKVKRVIVGDIIKEVGRYGAFDVTFVCEPFAYGSKTSCSYSSTIKSTTLKNVSSFKVDPKIEITGTGDIGININGEIVTIKGLNGTVVIDSNLMLCYSGLNNYLGNMNGDFPQLQVGDNKITLNGNISKWHIEWDNIYR